MAALCGGITGLGYLKNRAWLEQTYGVTPKERVRSGCHVVTEDSLDPSCLKGDYALLIGDSHADAVASVFGAELEKSGLRLVVLARGGCDPAWFTPEGRATGNGYQCANLMHPLEDVLAATDAPKVAIVISMFADGYSKDPNDVARLATMFNSRGTAVLFVGPVPTFPRPVLECVVQADQSGEKRDDCAALRESYSRREADAGALFSAGISGLALNAYAPIGDVFCDKTVCRPWDGDRLFFLDTNHVVPSGAKKLFDAVKPKLSALIDSQRPLK